MSAQAGQPSSSAMVSGNNDAMARFNSNFNKEVPALTTYVHQLEAEKLRHAQLEPSLYF